MKFATSATLILLSLVASSSVDATDRNLITTGVDFSSFGAGDIVTSLDSGTITVTAMVRPSKGAALVPGDAMIFDSSNPTGGDFDLGTPHKNVPGGVGVGKAGKPGQLFENVSPQGNVLIVQTPPPANAPNDNKYGGSLTFEFAAPRYVGSIGLLDNEEGITVDVHTSDGGFTTYYNGNGGNNSFENMLLGKPEVVKIVVTFLGSGALTNFSFSPPNPVCYLPMDDLELFAPGDEYTGPTGVQVSATHFSGAPAVAMVFDSSNPTGGDFDLGTPHQKVGGPGVGKGGKPGSLFPNLQSLGNILIISEGDALDPDDDASGGTITIKFSVPVDLYSLTLIDNEEGVLFDCYLSDGSFSSMFNKNGGNNSVETVLFGKKEVLVLKISFLSSGGISLPSLFCP